VLPRTSSGVQHGPGNTGVVTRRQARPIGRIRGLSPIGSDGRSEQPPPTYFVRFDR
jgi:hypothetical protein